MFHEFDQSDNFVSRFASAVKDNWRQIAVEDYNQGGMTYGQLAAEIEKTILLWKAAGLKMGEKVAINARSSANWARIFFSTQIGGFVSVQIFKGFTPHDSQGLVNHSHARILYTEKANFGMMDFEKMPYLMAAIDANTGELLASRDSFEEVWNRRDRLFEESYPNGFNKEDLAWKEPSLSVVSAIMYTSGSTGNPKGVMLTNLNISANLYAIVRHFPYRQGENYVSILPYSHIFGMVYDMIVPLCCGMHLVVLGLTPAPTNLIPAMKKYAPHVFFSVPLVLEKLAEAVVGDEINNVAPCNWPEMSARFMDALGGNVELFASGGAAINEDLEKLLVRRLRVPFITGYGMTEAAPTISLGVPGDYQMRECGRYLDEILEARIDSADGGSIPGEIMLKGPAVFKGYYKNPNATRGAFTADGWFRTGDVGIMDERGSIFIVGRCKNMILHSNGQNIFPEEIEVILNSLPYVAESIVIEKKGKLFAIIVPQSNDVANDNISANSLMGIMKRNIKHLNSRIPKYSPVSGFRLQYEPFAKTPKGTIKRFMYTE